MIQTIFYTSGEPVRWRNYTCKSMSHERVIDKVRRIACFFRFQFPLSENDSISDWIIHALAKNYVGWICIYHSKMITN